MLMRLRQQGFFYFFSFHFVQGTCDFSEIDQIKALILIPEGSTRPIELSLYFIVIQQLINNKSALFFGSVSVLKCQLIFVEWKRLKPLS